jgi:tetratricopeptide (TPR) repeat protein
MSVNQSLIKKYAIILIALVGILAYANSFYNSFQFDDGYHIVEGTKIKDIGNVLSLSHWKAVNDRPFSFFTLAIDYKLADKKPDGTPEVTVFHIFNLIYHVLAGFMAFLLALEILGLNIFKKNKIIQDNKVMIALFGAFIFIAHPIQTQAVTYIIQRMAVLAGLFYMWSVLLYIRGRKIHLEKTAKKEWIPYAYYAGAFVAGAFGFLSKQNAITFPLAFILAEILFIRNKELKIDRKFLGIFSAIIGAGLLLALVVNGLPREFDRISRSQYLFTQFRVLMKYWQLLLLPVNQHLDYYFTISMNLWGAKELLGLAGNLLIIALGIWLFMKKWHVASFAIFWFYLTLSIESSIIPIRDVIYEHRLYMAVFGFGFALSYLAFYFLEKTNAKYPVVALSLLSVIYIGASLNRNSVWKDPYSLWTDSVKKSPKRERAWYWLATYYSSKKQPEDAMQCYNTSIKCNPGFPLAYNGRANLKKETGDNQGAIKDYDIALQLDPNYITAYYNRGIVHAVLEQLDKAIQDYNRSIELGNRAPAIYYNRGNAKRRNRDYTGAIEDYNIALKMEPGNSLVVFNRGLTKAAMKDHSEAIKDIDQAIRLDPNNYLFYNGKGVSLIALNKFQDAISNFDQCIKVNPDFGQAYYNRAYVYQIGLNNTDKACKDWETALNKGFKGANTYLVKFCGYGQPANPNN